MNKEQLLDLYTKETEILREIESLYGEYINKYTEALNKIKKIEEEIKVACKQDADSVQNDKFIAIYTPKFKRFVDYRLAHDLLDEPGKAILDSITEVEYKVDRDKFETLIKEEILPNDVRIEAEKEIEIAPMVSIKLK